MTPTRSRRLLLAATTVLVSGVMAATGGTAVSAAPVAGLPQGELPALHALPGLPGGTAGAGRSTPGEPMGTHPAHDAPAAASLRIAVVGDSVAWGQGLADAHKYSTLVQQALATRTHRTVTVDVFAHSGSTLAGPCVPSAPVVPGELPFAAPSVACQLTAAAAAGHGWDLVLLSGCINDVTIQAVLFGTGRLAATVARTCARPLGQAVAAAGQLPGHPAVVVTGYYPIVSRQTSPTAFAAALQALGAGPVPDVDRVRLMAARRSAQFSAAFDEVARSAVTAARRGDSAVYVSPGFGPTDALFTTHSLLWTGADDEMLAARGALCASAPGLTPAQRQVCAVASIGHPNVAGAARYATRIDAALRRWFTVDHTRA